jgi:hypothetical protein
MNFKQKYAMHIPHIQGRSSVEKHKKIAKNDEYYMEINVWNTGLSKWKIWCINCLYRGRVVAKNTKFIQKYVMHTPRIQGWPSGKKHKVLVIKSEFYMEISVLHTGMSNWHIVDKDQSRHSDIVIKTHKSHSEKNRQCNRLL